MMGNTKYRILDTDIFAKEGISPALAYPKDLLTSDSGSCFTSFFFFCTDTHSLVKHAACRSLGQIGMTQSF